MIYIFAIPGIVLVFFGLLGLFLTMIDAARDLFGLRYSELKKAYEDLSKEERAQAIVALRRIKEDRELREVERSTIRYHDTYLNPDLYS
jgi:hypothetical protein